MNFNIPDDKNPYESMSDTELLNAIGKLVDAEANAAVRHQNMMGMPVTLPEEWSNRRRLLHMTGANAEMCSSILILAESEAVRRYHATEDLHAKLEEEMENALASAREEGAAEA